MFSTTVEKDRAQLGFAEAVLTAFDFLVESYGFRVTRAEPTLVRFESQRVFVNIYHGRSSYELGLEIGRLIGESGEGEHPFSLDTILMLDGAQNPPKALFQASTSQDVNDCVHKLASLVRKYAASALAGDNLTFKRLAEIRAKMSAEIHHAMRLRDIRAEADQAWKERNYPRVLELYESVKSDLTASEVKKLEYAQRHVST